MRKLSVLLLPALIVCLAVPAEASRPGDASTRIMCRTENDHPTLRFDDAAGPPLITGAREFNLGVFDILNAFESRMKFETLWESIEGAPPPLPGEHLIRQTMIDTFAGEESVVRFEWRVTAE